MGRSFTQLALTLSLTFLSGPLFLHAQSTLVRPKVSESLPHYLPISRIHARVEIPGTDALTDLGYEWNKVFSQFQPEGKIIYLPRLTKDILKEFQDGLRPIIITARELSTEETKTFQTKYGYLPMRIPVCLDANIVFVHKNNPITSITVEQLDAIYSKDLQGGAKAPAVVWGDIHGKGGFAKRAITAYSRDEGTATREAFRTAVLQKGTFRKGIISKEDPSSLAEAITTDETGIAFGPLASWYAGVKVLPVVPLGGSDPRFPDQENITSGRYPMPRLYYAYVNRAPGKPLDPASSEVLHFILSQEGQGAAAEVGIMPAPPEFVAIALKRLDR